MASPHHDDEWDKDTAEIQSEDSDYLSENRPNRWRGDPQTWLSITEEERLTYYALERVRNQDLSLHLYNAWALRQRQTTAAAGEDSDQEEVRPIFPTPKPDARDLLTFGLRMSTQRQANLSVTHHGSHPGAGPPGRSPRINYRRMIS